MNSEIIILIWAIISTMTLIYILIKNSCIFKQKEQEE